MIGKEYFDRDYFETPGVKSGYNRRNFNRDSYLYEAMVVWLNEFLPLAGKRILEIGCAYGWLVEWLVKNNFDAYGQDISHWAVTHAPPEIKDRIFECDDVEIAVPGKFDLILSFETLEHVPMNKVGRYIQNMFDCLNSGGIFFGSICLGHNNDRGNDPDESHQTLQPRSWWDARFREAGFLRRKDLEADAYEIGIQTPRMAEGQWLPRFYNWHIFAYEKPDEKVLVEPAKVYDRRLLARFATENKPRLLVIGSRPGRFEFPTEDFFQIDNWGNYLSYFFNGEYQNVRNEINFAKYDLLIAALDHTVVRYLPGKDFKQCRRKIGFLDGTIAMMSNVADNHESLLKLLPEFDVICAHATHARIWAKSLGLKAVECSHIFPFRFFDRTLRRVADDEFTILCAGYFNSGAHLTTFSVYLASKRADKVLIASEDAGQQLGNIEIFPILPQHQFYTAILSRADLILKMDNFAGVGRLIAEAAAGKIPAISGPDLFQIRCFPELLVPNCDALEEIETKISAVKEDADWVEYLGLKARERLRASNEAEFQTMLRILQSLGFEAERPKELYW